MTDLKMPTSNDLRWWEAAFPWEGRLLKMKFEAMDQHVALQIAKHYGGGLIGESTEAENGIKHVEQEALDMDTARQVLGGVSRSFVYGLLHTGDLERLPSRRILITRKSVRRYVDNRAR